MARARNLVAAAVLIGAGLGLAIVKRVVDEHAGTLAVETGAWGTRFLIRLPLNGPSSVSQQMPAQALACCRLRRCWGR
mgnify:CR=1 FL=1